MKPFTITENQIASVIGAACADELSRRFNRHVDFLTAATWGSDAALGAGGLMLEGKERLACAARVAAMFGLDSNLLSQSASIKIGDWAAQIHEGLSRSLATFSFKPAARGGEDLSYSHGADEIFQDAASAANVLYGRRRLLSFVAPHSLLGFELSVLTPNLLGIEAIDARGMPPEVLTEQLLFGDVLVATPTLWRYMMHEHLSAPDNTLAVSFGEPMAPELYAEMRKGGFGVMRELYGSTETGLIAWRDTPGEPFVLFDHWQCKNGRLSRISPCGGARAVEPMDALEWCGERSFELAGRRDGAVQIGAVNVFPGAVATAMLAHPDIARCIVEVGRRGDGATRLVANIVLDKQISPTEKTARAIDAWCRSNLRQQERPQIYNFESVLLD